MKRLHNLDYLRGLAACSIMVYHYQSWAYGSFSADTFWGRIGLYGVSIFYILSGLTLYLVNRKRFVVRDFFIKRFFRIYPLLILATVATLVLHRSVPPFKMLLLNITGLFGFITPRGYIATGAWSIGNELVFYALFPLFFALLQVRKAWLLWLVGGLLFALFSFRLLSPVLPIAQQWGLYVNPLNQVPYFICGLLIGYYLHKKDVPLWINAALLIIGVFSFVLFPTGTNVSELITGLPRLFFTYCITIISIGFYKSEVQLHPVLHRPLSVLGEASYSVYLLHPLVWSVVQKVPLPAWLQIALACTLSILLGYGVYKWIETYFIQMGKRVTYQKEKGTV